MKEEYIPQPQDAIDYIRLYTTPLGREGNMLSIELGVVEKETITNLKKIIPKEIFLSDRIGFIHMYNKYKAISESHHYSEDKFNLKENIIQSIIYLQDQLRELPSGLKPKFLVSVSFLWHILERLGFTIYSLDEGYASQTFCNLDFLDPVGSKLKMETQQIKHHTAKILELQQTDIDTAKRHLFSLKYLKENQKIRSKYSKQDIHIAFIEVDDFLAIDFSKVKRK